jgi:hypothetical protein
MNNMKRFPSLVDVYSGARFRLNFSDNMGSLDYILAQVDKDTFALISLMDGNRWNNPIKINELGLTNLEIDKIFACGKDDFWTKIEDNNDE